MFRPPRCAARTRRAQRSLYEAGAGVNWGGGCFLLVVGALGARVAKRCGCLVGCTFMWSACPAEVFSSLYGLLEGWIRSDGRTRSGGPVQYGGLQEARACRGACRSEGFSFGEHVPDRFGELAGDLDPGDLGAAVAPETGSGVLVVIAVDGGAGGVHGGFDERPTQVAGAVLDEPAAAFGCRRTGRPAGTGRCSRTASWVTRNGRCHRSRRRSCSRGSSRYRGRCSNSGTYRWSAPTSRRVRARWRRSGC